MSFFYCPTLNSSLNHSFRLSLVVLVLQFCHFVPFLSIINLYCFVFPVFLFCPLLIFDLCLSCPPRILLCPASTSFLYCLSFCAFLISLCCLTCLLLLPKLNFLCYFHPQPSLFCPSRLFIFPILNPLSFVFLLSFFCVYYLILFFVFSVLLLCPILTFSLLSFVTFSFVHFLVFSVLMLSPYLTFSLLSFVTFSFVHLSFLSHCCHSGVKIKKR